MGQYSRPRNDNLSDLTSKCKWCGKPKVKLLWSGRNGQYCSFKCSAAGSYPRSIIVAVAMSGLTAILFLIYAIMQGQHPEAPIPAIFGIPLAVVVILNSTFIYMVYIGRTIRNENQR